MPIQNYRFTNLGGISRPMLWIRVTNPSKRLGIICQAIVDTGADDCLFPSSTAIQLGHDLKSVAPKTIISASGLAHAYPHTSRIEVLGMTTSSLPDSNVLYTIQDTLIDFIEGGGCFLLGSRTFLSRFVLTIDYPRQVFSIRNPS